MLSLVLVLSCSKHIVFDSGLSQGHQVQGSESLISPAMTKRRSSANDGRQASWNAPSKKRQMTAPPKALATRRQGHHDVADALQQPAPDTAVLSSGSNPAAVSGQLPARNAIRIIDVRDREAWRKSHYGPVRYRVITGIEWLQVMLPQLMTVLVMLILIFGGCCSNVSRLSGLKDSELAGAPALSPMEPKRRYPLTFVLVV